MADYDLIVAGGGLAAVCCAIAAAEEGSRVLLLNDRPVLGGNSSSECGVPPHGADALGHNRNLRESGIMEELRLEFYCRRSANESNLKVWDELLSERCSRVKNLTVLLNCRVDGVVASRSCISAVSGVNLLSGETFSYSADLFADGTGNGALGYLSGAQFRFGREAADEFGEHELGRAAADSSTLGCSIYGHAVRRDCPVSYTPPEDAIRYTDCESLSHRSHNIRAIFPKLACKDDFTEFRFFWWLEWGGDLNVIEDEDVIYDRLKRELFGLWDHLKNHCSEETCNALACFELQDYTAFPLRRESRRLVGDYILNENDCASGRIFDDAIGYGGWPMDDHPPMGIASREPGCRQLFLSGPYTVPYRCCYSANIDNLFLLGRCISVTHAALSSVRVMNTLAALGEAVGTAAALCREYSISPRELGKKAIHTLQQRCLSRDLFIPGIKREFIQLPHAVVSSSRPLSGTVDEFGRFDLRYPTFLQLPLSSNELTGFRILIEAQQDTELLYSFSESDSVESVSAGLLREMLLPVKAGKHWLELLPSPITFSRPVARLCMMPNPDILWYYGSELYHTRWGVRADEDGEALSYHGAAKQLTRDGWIFCNGNGRPTAEAALWLRNLPGYHVHDKLLVTPCFALQPVQYPYGTDSLLSGISRGEALPNIWISQASLPQSCSFSFDEPIDIRQIEIIFDTNLDYADQRYGFPRGDSNPDLAIPSVIRETVSDYTLSLVLADGTEKILSVSDNIHRRNLLSVQVKGLRSLTLTVTATRGCPEARVFGIYLR